MKIKKCFLFCFFFWGGGSGWWGGWVRVDVKAMLGVGGMWGMGDVNQE